MMDDKSLNDKSLNDKMAIGAINGLTQLEMAKLARFAKSSHPYFVGKIGEHFQKRFKELGGMTTGISKMIGWED